MDNERVKLLFGDGEPIDEVTAASLGLLHIVERSSCKDVTDTKPESSKTRRGHECHLNSRTNWSALMYAAYYHRTNVIKYLVSSSSKDTLENERFEESGNILPLQLAVLSGNKSSVQLLLTTENLDMKDIFDKTALYWAIETNQLEIIKFLLNKGASPNILCEGISCVGLAAMQGNNYVIEKLLTRGGQVCLNEQTETPIMLALANNNLKTASFLINYVKERYSLEELLKQVNLHKYWPIFQNNNIDYTKFLQLTETDIKNYGINLLGPRKKLSMLISIIKDNKEQLYPVKENK